ncbi:Bipolar kinesin KRP-130 [Harpegnathos saltator]|uniref:Kinesin-like protein n=1 Tax=Harpegnathos saltator TaxID=610380 RepID=E2BTC2_HARSA|nr:Bipolar kinesin KRP-130 [Harpegnathos saltator]
MSRNKDQHVNVFVRVKPLSEKGTSGKNCEKPAVPVVQVASEKEIIVCERSQDKVAKKFTFDKVFGPTSTQLDVYNTVIKPLLKEVLAGYSCTVFAYGQTGTGKTYTMEGGRVEDPGLHWQSDTSAGMIPRCLSHLFDELQLLENQQYVVKINFLELYNEELFDLLGPSSHDATKIKLYEDMSKKGSVIIHGLEEVTVRNKTKVYKILEKGSERRQTAATLMNSNSSRSHTVFSITIHMKEDTPDGEELLKTAKLNLVDLAGSENVSKSGAVDKRARETRNINQSLLTLGRVITALVERAPHIPYRESKLTRLLQESLGGRTKTSIIATISSASSNVDETLSTLDYAYRAKHITNRPEINQRLFKRAPLKEYTEEVERLRKDLTATRDKNGIYLSQDKYDSMHALINWQKKKIQDQINDFKAMEECIESKEKIFNDVQSQYDAQTSELTKKTSELNDLTHSLQSLQDSLKEMENSKDEQKYLVEMHASTEKILRNQAESILNVVVEASEDAQKLHEILDRQTKIEEKNKELRMQMKSDFTKRVKDIEDNLMVHTKELEQFFSSIKEVESQIATEVKNIKEFVPSILKDLVTCRSDTTEQLIKDIAVMKMMDLSHDFMHLDKCEKSYSENVNRSYQIHKICSNICDQVAQNSNADITAQNNLQTFVQNNVSQIKSSIDSNFKEAQVYDKIVTEKGNALISNLQQDLNTGNATLKEYNSNIESNVQQLQKEIIENKTKAVATTDIISKTTEDLNLIHKEFLAKIQSKISDFSTIMSDKFITQDAELNNWCNKSTNELRTSQQQIDEFTKNSYRDVETGATPPRKEFLYSHELTTTLPHKQLIQRFWESRKNIEGTDESNNKENVKTTQLKKIKIKKSLMGRRGKRQALDKYDA